MSVKGRLCFGWSFRQYLDSMLNFNIRVGLSSVAKEVVFNGPSSSSWSWAQTHSSYDPQDINETTCR